MSRKWLGFGVGIAGLVLLLLVTLGPDDVIDLPAWTDVKGIDVPFIGDTDAIDCRLSQVEGTTMVQIRVVDGDESTYPDYVHVWNNGNLVPEDEIDRVTVDEWIVSSTPGTDEQFYAISIEPVREGRVFCESIILR